MREQHAGGTINLNSNASLPEVVAELAEAGLDSMRVSLNSPRADVYDGYYNPRHYGIAEVERSMREMKSRGKYVSTNLLYFPGVTDTDAELEAFGSFAERTELDLVQVRNLNIDPELYVESIPEDALQPGFGVSEFMRRLSARLPKLAFGYFNPTREDYAELGS
jgi:MoaA/NifB/PqqE/SkfB family radical SAM enzyme